MTLKLRPSGLGSGIDKDRPDYTVFTGEESAHETYLSRLQINAGRPYAGPSIKKMMKVESPAKFDNAAIAPMWRSERLNVLQITSGWRYVGKRNGAFRIRCLGDHG
jgi:hypothetical protein